MLPSAAIGERGSGRPGQTALLDDRAGLRIECGDDASSFRQTHARGSGLNVRSWPPPARVSSQGYLNGQGVVLDHRHPALTRRQLAFTDARLHHVNLKMLAVERRGSGGCEELPVLKLSGTLAQSL